MNNKTTITKWFSMLLLMLVAGVSGAVAQSLTISEFVIAAGETKDVAITLTPASSQTIYGVQTDVVLSEGLTLTSATSVDEDLSLSWNEENNRLILLSMNDSQQQAIAEGDIITLSITAADDFEGGTVTLSNSRLTTSKMGAETNVSDCEVAVTLDGPFEPVDMTDKVLADGWVKNEDISCINFATYNKDVVQQEHYAGRTDETGDVMYQEVWDLPNGTYTVELYANASYTPGRGFDSEALDGELGRVIVYAFELGGHRVAKTIPVIHQTGVSENNIVTLENVVVTDGSLILGLAKIAPGSNWHTIQIKSLTMTSEQTEVDEAFVEAQNTYWTDIAATIAAYEAYEVVDGDERTALTSATTTEDVILAIPPFYAIKEHYDLMATAKEALDAMKAVMDGTNVYTAEAFETYNGIYTANLAKYEAGTLTDDEAGAIVNPSKAITWGERSQEKYGDAPTFLLSSWEPQFPDFSTYYINTWSTEGDTDGSEFKVPFFEYFTGAGESLAEKTLTATVEDLENGLYKVTAWVRVETKNGVAATDATGITLAVNEGEEADVTEGTQIGETLRSLGTFEAQGLVKDGTLNIKFNVASGNNIHWLSFKNVTYEKVRDLSEEEAGFDDAMQELADAITAAKEIDTTDKIGVEDLAAAIETAEAALNDAEATYASIKAAKSALEQAIEAFELANKPFSIDDYLVNADFSSTVGWTVYAAGNHNEGNGLIGTYKVREEFGASTVDESHLATEYCLAVETRWQTNYSSFNQETTKELPAGIYKLTYDVQNVNSGTTPAAYNNMFYVQVGDQKYTDGSTEWMNGATSWTAHSITFKVEKAGKAKVSFGYGTGSNNYPLANTPALYISHLNLESLELATEEDYVLMDEAIADAEAKAMGFEAGEYAPYNNIEPLTLLAAAKAIDKTAMNAKEDVLALGDATWVENEEEVNGIYDGDFVIQTVPSVNTRPLGWNRNSVKASVNNGTDSGYETRLINLVSGVSASGKGMMTKHHAFYGDQLGYELPLKANTYYVLSFKYCGYNNSPTMHINVYGEDGTKVANSNDFSSKDSKGHEKADSWQEFSYTFKTAEAGNYVIGIIKNTGGTEQNQAGFTDISLVKAPKTVPMVVTDAKWATFVAPFDVAIADIPSGVKVYVVEGVSGETDEIVMGELDVTIPANKPVVLFSETAVETELEGVEVPVGEEGLSYGILVGTYEDMAAPNGSYILQNHDGAVAFYRVDTQQAEPMVRAYHAYLDISDGARAYYLNGEATAIGALKALTSGDAEIYDVNGRKQVKLQKGVNIIRTKDGQTRKVMVK